MISCSQDVFRLRALVEERESQVQAQETQLERLDRRSLEGEQAELALFALHRNLQLAREQLDAALRRHGAAEPARLPTRSR